MGVLRLTVAGVCVGALVVVGAHQALASDRPVATTSDGLATTTLITQDQQQTISDADYAQAFEEFESTSVPRDSVLEGGVQVVTFHFTDTASLTMVDPASVPATPQLSGGRNRYGFWIGFNQFDQNVLSNAVAAATLTAAICAIPGVGTAACFVAGVAVSVGVSYVHKNGVCRNNLTLYWYDVRGGSTIRCLSGPPRP
jgi:hypothetical protein